MKRYSWIASSNDGSFKDEGLVWFETRKEAYEDMRTHALEKMKWNTELVDFSDMDDEDWIGYDVKFHPNYIVHESYSGVYTYRMVEKNDTIKKYGVEWTILDSYTINEEDDWKVADFGNIGVLWMNNCEGYKVLFEPNGTILFSYI